MKKNILHIFYYALAALLCLSSCALEEPVGTHQNSDGYIEFVARPTSYNKYDVATKADGPNPIEDVAYNAFLLIFDNEGQLILRKQVIPSGETTSTTAPTTTIPKDKGLSNVTACYLINVPHSFVNGIEALTMPADATDEYKAANYNKYVNTAVLEGITYKSGTPMGVPKIDHDDNPQTPEQPCIPMFGKASFNLQGTSSIKQIPLKRLFAKVTINLQMDLNLSDWNNLIQTYTYYQLNYYTLHNLPTKVRLEEGNSECAWTADVTSFTYADDTGNGSGSINDGKIYNKGSNTSGKKSHEFILYVPEYYLNPKQGWTNKETHKPDNVRSGTYPIYVTLAGVYSQYSVTSATIQHKVLLGGDATANFSLARNVNYINYLTIKGVNNNKDSEDENTLDHRVSTEFINNPVAESGQSANCYVIGKTGDYSFPAYKGAYNDLTEAVLCNNATATTLEVIANDNSSKIQLSKLSYDPNRNIVSFTIDKIDDGNVVIALKNKDTSTEWSWHLWCTTQSIIDVLGWGAMKTQTYPSGVDLMDRNLGAKESSITLLNQNNVIGLYYRYGQKEPFLGGAYQGGGTLLNEAGEAIAPLWANAKSPTDPCPPGYKVPSSTVWSAIGSHNSGLEAYIYAPTSTTEVINFPYAGYINASGNKQDEESSYVFDVVISEEYTGIANKFKNIRYSLAKNADLGILSTVSSQEYQRYLGARMSLSELSNLTPTLCDISKNNWGKWSDYETRALTSSELRSLKTLMVFSGDYEISSFEQDFTANSNNGYQVRCVVDTQ